MSYGKIRIKTQDDQIYVLFWILVADKIERGVFEWKCKGRGNLTRNWLADEERSQGFFIAFLLKKNRVWKGEDYLRPLGNFYRFKSQIEALMRPFFIANSDKNRNTQTLRFVFVSIGFNVFIIKSLDTIWTNWINIRSIIYNSFTNAIFFIFLSFLVDLAFRFVWYYTGPIKVEWKIWNQIK